MVFERKFKKAANYFYHYNVNFETVCAMLYKLLAF